MTKPISRRVFASAMLAASIAGTNRPARSEMVEDCRTITEPVKYEYCIAKTNAAQTDDVLYVLHGGGGDQHGWKAYVDVFDAWERAGVPVPAVVTVSFDRIWVLAEKNAAPKSGLLELFAKDVMPKIETLALGHAARRRFLVGCSMGGINGAALLLKLPPQTFARAVLAAPAMMDVSPWAPEQQAADFSRRTGIAPDAVSYYQKTAKFFASDEAFWNERINPLTIVKTQQIKDTGHWLYDSETGFVVIDCNHQPKDHRDLFFDL